MVRVSFNRSTIEGSTRDVADLLFPKKFSTFSLAAEGEFRSPSGTACIMLEASGEGRVLSTKLLCPTAYSSSSNSISDDCCYSRTSCSSCLSYLSKFPC